MSEKEQIFRREFHNLLHEHAGCIILAPEGNTPEQKPDILLINMNDETTDSIYKQSCLNTNICADHRVPFCNAATTLAVHLLYKRRKQGATVEWYDDIDQAKLELNMSRFLKINQYMS